MRALGLALLLAACSAGTPTSATALQVPADLAPIVAAAQPVVAARWPGCTLAGWQLVGRATRFPAPAGTRCGTGACPGTVRGLTDTRARTITVWTLDPALGAVVAWEACNACRWEQTRQLQDTGCA